MDGNARLAILGGTGLQGCGCEAPFTVRVMNPGLEIVLMVEIGWNTSRDRGRGCYMGQ